jgi:hypothetical protein
VLERLEMGWLSLSLFFFRYVQPYRFSNLKRGFLRSAQRL